MWRARRDGIAAGKVRLTYRGIGYRRVVALSLPTHLRVARRLASNGVRAGRMRVPERSRARLVMTTAIALICGAALTALGTTATPDHISPGSSGSLHESVLDVSQRQSARPAADPARPRISGLAHVAFRVTTLEASRAFYGDLLGLVQSGQANGLRARYRVNHRQEILLEPGLPAADDERLSHVAFETEDLDALAAYLKAHDVTIESEPPAPAARCAARALWVKDPDGHPLEFVEPSPSAPRGGRAGGAPPTLGARLRAPISDRALHAGLIVRDAAAADRFYKAVLGFAEIWRGGRTDAELSWINMKVPDGTDYLEYMLVNAGATVSRQQRGVLHHVALLVPDIQAAHEAARRRAPEAARRTMASPQVGRNNRWQLNLYDPDGSRVELMEPFTMR